MKTDEIFSLRNNFSIVGLTGRTGSGCSLFADIISDTIQFEGNDMIRTPNMIKYINPKGGNKSVIESEEDTDETGEILPVADNNTLFKRKYTICYKFLKQNNTVYTKISYPSVLIFYTLTYGINVKNVESGDKLASYLLDIINKNFKKSETDLDKDYKNSEISLKEIKDLCDYDKLYTSLKAVKKHIDKIDKFDELKELNISFFQYEFPKLAKNLLDLMSKKDYYLGSFFVHGLGNKIRATGDPTLEYRVDYDKHDVSPQYVYSIVKIINKLIKAWKSQQVDGSCHIVIDSLRNSLEIMFLKERYSAFYMIAIHNENRCEERLTKRIEESKEVNPNGSKKVIKKVIRLDEAENDGSSIKAGKFFAPDVENCIQKSEVHINNPGSVPADFNKIQHASTFYTMTEQWIKINALILHPGIITPSHEERCMQIAYNSKFNSGCISRQVGAMITDKNNSIKSVGWNDVPHGSIPCNLRSIEDIINPGNIDELDLSYSPFEKDTSGKEYKYGGTFHQNTKKHFSEMAPKVEGHKLNYSYCFKTLHNKYEQKDNQVHTRSLHAEENAMLQVSKFGGQPLKGGTLYTTASPCELCAKKAYQLGLKIVYIDPYPGISRDHILKNGYYKPDIKMFTGIIGRSYNKLFEPLLAYKDELSLITESKDDKDKAKKNLIRNFIHEVFEKKISNPDEIDLIEFKKSINYLLK